MTRQSAPAPPPTVAETLTEQFYAWERRGRGWQVWDHAVELEPPFRPFRLSVEHALGADDGQRPTFLSRLKDDLLGRAAPQADVSPTLDLEEDEPGPDDGDVPRAELELALPADAEVSPEAAEQLLLSLPRAGTPCGFTVIGTSDQIRVQLGCGARDAEILASQLRAHFPHASVVPSKQTLADTWRERADEAIVVDFGLSDEFMLPLRVPRRFTVDPLTGVFAAMSELEPDEVGVLQVLWQPVRHAWADNTLRAVLDEKGGAFFIDAPEIAKLAREKVARPLFACVVRVGARAATRERAMLIGRSIGWGLRAVANPPANRLIPLDNRGYPDSAHVEDLLGGSTRRSGMILSSAELAALVHPPAPSVKVEKLVRETTRTRSAPNITGGHDYRLGVNVHGGREVEVALSEEQRSRHLYVIGASGMGKSTLLLNLMLQDLRQGRGLALLDPHGDLVDELLLHMPPERAQDVVLLDPADAEYPIGFNVLSARSELERTLISSDLVAVFRRLSTSWGDQMTSVLGNAILAFLESERGGTLVDLRRFLVEPAFRKEFLRTVRDSEVVYYWEREFPLLAGKPQAPLLTRLDTFLRPKTIRHMVAQKDSKLDLRRLMDEGKVLLARLSQGAIGEENAYLLGTLLVSRLQQMAMSRQELEASERRPFYLYIDEFHNFVTPSMEAILSGARKYRLGLVLAHQDLAQVRSRSADVLNSVLSNPYARVCFRVGDQDARTLADGFAHFDARDLQSLPVGRAIVRVERSDFDFNLSADRPPALDRDSGEGVRAEILARSRATFGRPRAEVEASLGQPREVSADVTLPVEQSTPTVAGPTAAVEIPTSVPATVENPTATVVRPTAPAAGRGGPQHRYVQTLISRWAEANDWRAVIEEPVLGGLGRVDVALRKGERSLACEIAVSTTPEHELGNAQKCLAAGFERVFLVATDVKTLRALRTAAESTLEKEQLARLRVCPTEELFDLLDACEAEAGAKEQTVRGYRVKVRYKTTGTEEGKARRGVVSGVVAKALRRLQGHSRED